MAGIDGEGFHLRVGKRAHRLGFDEPVTTMPALRQKLTGNGAPGLNAPSPPQPVPSRLFR